MKNPTIRQTIFLSIFLSITIHSSCLEKTEREDTAKLNIALLQMRSNWDIDWNTNKAEEFCRTAKNKGADIALLPEMIRIGYHGVDFQKETALDEWNAKAVSKDGEFVQKFKDLAKELDMAIVLTYLEDIGKDKLPRNSASLIDRHGKIVFTYSKVHTCDFLNMENSTTPGDGFYVGELDTHIGPVNVGIMICYDREAPESARILMLKGAEIILTPNACELEDLRLSQFKTRAFENAVACAMTNYSVEGSSWLNGHSCIFNADGEEILMAGEKEGVYIGSINMDEIRSYRENTIWGNAFRRPHKYEELTSPEVEDVFKRKDSYGNDFERLKR